ncbi:MAG TPA: hypothetical protein VGF48_01155 [Thermoanaerobaculia bacterium]|jgi:hypothetical protein
MHPLLLAAVLALDLTSALPAFQELDAMCKADGGRLWNRSLCGPTILVDPASRKALTRDQSGKIAEVTLPESLGIANTAVDWNGERWTMVMLPLPEDKVERRALLAHESFHRIQEELGFPATGPANAHLDSLEGRYWLRMEWRALAAAMSCGCEGDQRRDAIEDALIFRAKRQALFAAARAEEQQLEMHEGLAEHTGMALADPCLSRRMKSIAKKLDKGEKKEALVRNFAYASGPAWGALVEMKNAEWTREAKRGDDLAELARAAWGLVPADATLAEKRAERYEGAKVREEELARDRKRVDKVAKLRARYVDGPLLVLPLGQMQMQFDPNGLQPLEGVGTVYRTITLSDAWGKIVARDGALISSDFKKLIVPDASDFELTLSPGWKREGGTVVRE